MMHNILRNFLKPENPYLYIAGGFLVVTLFFSYLASRPDVIIEQMTKELSKNMRYITVRDKTINAHYDKSGVIGEFWTCLLDYRHISSRKAKRYGGPLQLLNIKVNTAILDAGFNYKLRLSVSENEAYSFSVEKYDTNETYIGLSDLYAVNCDLSLLNEERSGHP